MSNLLLIDYSDSDNEDGEVDSDRPSFQQDSITNKKKFVNSHHILDGTEGNVHRQNLSHQDEHVTAFGYSCKFFHDAVQYLSICNGDYLVPWFNNSDLMIDRYDVRGLLSDITQFDSDFANLSLNSEDVELEKELDKERYLDMDVNIEEQNTLIEEDEKRAKQTGLSSVPFNYDDVDKESNADTSLPITDGSLEPAQIEDEDPLYVPPASLLLSDDIAKLPKTQKQADIIERTAKFVVENGSQMEIVIKAKQSKNPAFSFLTYNDDLNPFYRHVVYLMRQGRYVTYNSSSSMDSNSVNTSSLPHKNVEHANSEQHDNEKWISNLPKVNTSDTSYSKLLQKFQLKKLQVASEKKTLTPTTIDTTQTVVDSTAIIDAKTSDCSVIVGSIDEMSRHERLQEEQETPPPVVASTDIEQDDSTTTTQSADVESSEYYNTYYQEWNRQYKEQTVIIEKLAQYVAKNGSDFEQTVRLKMDPRFAFLDVSHPLNQYYCQRRDWEIQMLAFQQQQQKQTEVSSHHSSVSSVDISNNGNKKTLDESLETQQKKKMERRKRAAADFVSHLSGKAGKSS